MQVTFDPLNPIESAVVAAILSSPREETAYPAVADNNAGDRACSETPSVGAAIGGGGVSGDESAPAAEPKKRTRRTKAQIEADAVTEAGSTADEPAAEEMVWEDETVVETVSVTIDDVRAAVQQCTSNHGMNHALKILNSFAGASRISELKPEDYASVVKACKVG
jgi:hypothetical protein